MIDNSDKLNKFSRRTLLLGAFKASLITILFGRLFYLQFLKHTDYKVMSEKNKLRISIIIPLRGKIYDRNKIILADNKQVYRLLLDKNLTDNYLQTIKKIVTLLDLSPEDENLFIKKAKHAIGEIILVDDLNWEQLTKIEANIRSLEGTIINYGYSRHYQVAEETSHVIGYIGYTNINELVKKPQSEHEIKIGKTGIEKFYDDKLKGKSGLKKYEVDAYGNVVRELSIENSVRGESISLSLDYNLQKLAYDLFQNEDGSATLMNIHTGELEVLLSMPGYNNNLLSKKLNKNEWIEIIKNPRLPMINKVISSYYAPGSAFKIVTYLAALENNFDPNKIVNCTGGYSLGGRIFHCSNKNGHGPLNLYQALMKSCNCYTFEIAKYIGIENISAMSHLLGLGKKTNIELPNELAGLVPDKKWVKKNGKTWQLGDTLNTSIGQGYLQTTPLQLTQMMARVMSGKNITPTIIKNENQKIFSNLNIKSENFNIIAKSLNMVVNDAGGTAFRSKLDSSIKMGGKTSTVQVISKRHTDEDLSNANVDRQFRNHGVFLGYGPVDNPKYCACVYVEHVGFAKKAIKICHKLIEAALLKKTDSIT